ncbi:MAG: cupin domain-containing protein [Methylovirgula sp.]|uniref:cupin domain-containing protein n=1 Tax=Methylovirgula sp. TaxID=1978224 RepID=UPI003075F6B8
MRSAAEIIEALRLTPHPEGGYFRETFRDGRVIGGRTASTAIYYLLAAGQRSHWHRVDAAEIWHWYAGAPLLLSIKTAEKLATHSLGPDLFAGEEPQAIVPAHAWQSAEPAGAWALVGCTVAPGFEFSQFELAAPDWRP